MYPVASIGFGLAFSMYNLKKILILFIFSQTNFGLILNVFLKVTAILSSYPYCLNMVFLIQSVIMFWGVVME